ncbi:hypothetical protein KR51_00003730 [Rubidibacter lacunae KORDI 51-2]|uniref:Ferritin-like domain-containing protein n=1 Tax=Rubidibacter lacunae KORDI 51-2 TaxID=582515 RepID=U5DQE2_9CHRO|nr:hypothetical protein [Rubidibacter lacunae]ERN43057.1 hypothetical protein KR51_00003730 [Rubidibacter lacunae KORDI 51-2]
MNAIDSNYDLAGCTYMQPRSWQTATRVNWLINHYLTDKHLSDRVRDLPTQFADPQPRLWETINWNAIEPEHILGMPTDDFLAILSGIIDTETPIRWYTQTSRQYLEPIHPEMARFVGGIATDDGTLVEPGLWEKEERQHAPALRKVYRHLTGRSYLPNPPSPKLYRPSGSPLADLYRHGLHRVVTECGATCLYIWLMARTTGPLQQVFYELARDEINHACKFWGFGVWLYPDSYLARLWQAIAGDRVPSERQLTDSVPVELAPVRDLSRTFYRMSSVLAWNDWSAAHKLEFVHTCARVMGRLLSWHRTLTPEFLRTQFGQPPAVR